MPACRTTRAPASPEECTESTSGWPVSVATSAAGSAVVATTSRSLTESASRRREPATSTRSTPGAARRASAICSAIGCARESSQRGAGRPVVARGERLEQLLLRLGAEAAQAAQLLRLGRLAQLLERVDAELVVQAARALGPEAGQVHHRDQAAGELRAQLRGLLRVAGLDQHLELLLQRLADAGKLGHAAVAHELLDRHGRLADRPRGGPVRDHAVLHGAVELVEIPELVEVGGDLGVRHSL